ncbi:hypothetical protein BV22DRAFT_1027298, partial [Leucogyrophana mollusca]
MPYAKGAKYQPEKQCLPGTRMEIMDEILDWVYGDDAPRIFLLKGVAGSGKSAIAHTIAQQFHKLGRLGSSFCFDRSNLVGRHPTLLFSTIARDLADMDQQYWSSLSKAVKSRAGRNSQSMQEQFEEFIKGPMGSLDIIGPILIVIDALDE